MSMQWKATPFPRGTRFQFYIDTAMQADEATMHGASVTEYLVDGNPRAVSSDNPLPVRVTGVTGLTNAEIRAMPLEVSGVVGLTGPVAVTGQFYPQTQAVTGQFYQSVQPVSGDFYPATQTISGSVTANAGSGTFNVAGAVTVNAGTNLNTSALATNATLSTLSGKVTKCDTDNVGLKAGTAAIGSVVANAGTDLNTSLLAREGTLAALGDKVTKCNTDAVGLVPVRGVLTNRSGNALGTSAKVADANPNRQYLYFLNTSAGDIWINFGASATLSSPSIRVPGGKDYTWQVPGYVPTQQLNAIGNILSYSFTCLEG